MLDLDKDCHHLPEIETYKELKTNPELTNFKIAGSKRNSKLRHILVHRRKIKLSWEIP